MADKLIILFALKKETETVTSFIKSRRLVYVKLLDDGFFQVGDNAYCNRCLSHTTLILLLRLKDCLGLDLISFYFFFSHLYNLRWFIVIDSMSTMNTNRSESQSYRWVAW